ncbi:MAG: methyltransferase regulatory domain-containing protein [Gammaproteobacteria bacterium]|nr:methyltransferase regulatory domain-containing protein [Gammaproteobacteria bacterium]
MTSTLDSYDQIPYDAVPITDTHPDHLCVLGRMFGLQTADPERCRVLEFGCADGANIIPLAYYLPRSEFVGVELSQVQVDTGRVLIEQLQLTNIDLLHHDVLTLPDTLGTFDYIIAHGIFSWVPPQVQERILELCGHLLAPHGVAYISYNTLPGWRGRAMLRDMLLHHCRHLHTPRERLHAAEELLEFLHTGYAGLESPSVDWLKQEVAHLRQASRSYLFHEYLEDINAPLLFSDFMQRAQQHGLKYLCDSDLYTMFPSTLGDAAAKLLEPYDDLLEQEQYMDFLRARPFRRSVLCRDQRELQRELNLDFMREYGIVAYLTPRDAPDFAAPRSQSYLSASGKDYAVTHPLTKHALQQLVEVFPNALHFDALADTASTELIRTGAAPLAQQHTLLLSELFSLFSARALMLTPREQRYFNQVSEHPHAHRLAHIQAARGHVPSVRHIDVDLDPLSRHLLTQLDGTRTRGELTQNLICEIDQDLGTRDALVSHDRDATQMHQHVSDNVDRLLALFARHGLLAG